MILFGNHTTSYKFALHRSLIELGKTGESKFSLRDLAIPFTETMCQHLKEVDRQGHNPTSRFLEHCRAFNDGDMSKGDLLSKAATTSPESGFRYVLDLFHKLPDHDAGFSFFEPYGAGRNKGIILTDELHELLEQEDRHILDAEVEGRWSLLEAAWELGIGQHHLNPRLEVDLGLEHIFVDSENERRNVTTVRDALSPYQKGQCFYCGRLLNWFKPHQVDSVEVDHFYPWKLHRHGFTNLNGVWNLVLACRECNGPGGKGSGLTDLECLKRLERRNNYLIESHHPLEKTLENQTGSNRKARRAFLKDVDNEASKVLGLFEYQRWEPIERHELKF